MLNYLDDSLYQIEKESLNYSDKEMEYNFSLDPKVIEEFDEIKIFNEFKKVLDFNEPNFDSEDISDEDLYFISINNIADINLLRNFSSGWYHSYLYYACTEDPRMIVLYYLAGMTFSLLVAWAVQSIKSIFSKKIKAK